MENIAQMFFWMVACHMAGDYVLQTDFLAKTKGENWYHLFAHSILYVVPFFVVFGMVGGWFTVEMAIFLLTTHFVIDAWKARYKTIGYVEDQALHYIVLLFILVTTFI